MPQLPAVRQSGLQLTTIEDIKQTAQLLVSSGMFEDTRDVAKACVKIIAGQEYGFTPYVAMTGIHLIQGRPTISANLIGAAIKRSGRYNYRVKLHNAEVCVITFFENGENVGDATFTIEEARAAGLAAKDIWRKYPKALLFARTISSGARTYCPDIFCGPVYAPEDFDAVTNEDGSIIEADVEVTAPAPKPVATTAENLKTTAGKPADTTDPKSAPAAAGNTPTAAAAETAAGNGQQEPGKNSAPAEKQADPKPVSTAGQSAAPEAKVASGSASTASQGSDKVTKVQMDQLREAAKANGWTNPLLAGFLQHAFQLTKETLTQITQKQWETACKVVGRPENAGGKVVVSGSGEKLAPEKCWPKAE